MTQVRISDALIKAAKAAANAEHRSLEGQIEHWVSIGRVAEENPELPFSMIREILLAKAATETGRVDEYVFGEDE